MKNCPMCGKELPDSARFCGKCGHVLNDTIDGATNMDNSPPTNRKSLDEPVTPSRIPTLVLPDGNEQELESIPTKESLPVGRQAQSGNEEEQESISTKDSLPVERQAQSGNEAGQENGVEKQPTAILPASPASELQQTPPSESEVSLDHAETWELPAQVTGTPASKRRIGSAARWLIIGMVSLVVIAGSASALVVLLHLHLPGTGGTPTARPGLPASTEVTPTLYACPSVTTSAPSICSAITPGTGNGNVKFPIDLTFAGAVTGHMTVTNWETCGTEQAVGGGLQYHVAVFGTVSGQQYGFTFNVYPYTLPSTYSATAFSFFGPAGETSSLTKWRSSPNLGVSVTINSDGKSGNLDIGFMSSGDNSRVRVMGSWKCV